MKQRSSTEETQITLRSPQRFQAWKIKALQKDIQETVDSTPLRLTKAISVCPPRCQYSIRPLGLRQVAENIQRGAYGTYTYTYAYICMHIYFYGERKIFEVLTAARAGISPKAEQEG